MALYYYKNAKGGVEGPVAESEILDLRESGRLRDESLVCPENSETWVALADLNLQRVQAPRQYWVWAGVIIAALILFVVLTNRALNQPSGHNNSGAPDASMATSLNQFRDNSAWTKLYPARAAALEADPSLSATCNELLNDMKSQPATYDSAMVRIDPTVAPLVAKFRSSPLTPNEVQALLAARFSAAHANPALFAGDAGLSGKVTALLLQLDAAATKADPSLTPLAKRAESGTGGRIHG